MRLGGHAPYRDRFERFPPEAVCFRGARLRRIRSTVRPAFAGKTFKERGVGS
jgi:hypothetical protein